MEHEGKGSEGNRQEIGFAFERSTKNTHVYAESVQPGVAEKIGTLYVKKWVVGDRAPQDLKVTLEWE
ncbi:MAG: hypothetical protein ACE5NC_03050 [Anaerolineae bacterium]